MFILAIFKFFFLKDLIEDLLLWFYLNIRLVKRVVFVDICKDVIGLFYEFIGLKIMIFFRRRRVSKLYFLVVKY